MKQRDEALQILKKKNKNGVDWSLIKIEKFCASCNKKKKERAKC